jgi:hypothetical protein
MVFVFMLFSSREVFPVPVAHGSQLAGGLSAARR